MTDAQSAPEVTQELLPVIQADREAAADLNDLKAGYAVGGAIRLGMNDEGLTVQAFARHRHEAVQSQGGDLREALERARYKVGHVTIDAMQDDNLAVTLCTVFDDADGEQDDFGWTEAATAGCDATLTAIHQVYIDALASTTPPAITVDRDAGRASEDN